MKAHYINSCMKCDKNVTGFGIPRKCKDIFICAKCGTKYTKHSASVAARKTKSRTHVMFSWK
mgnify:CR=1 FL=1